MKKIISFILSVVLVFSCCAIFSFAERTDNSVYKGDYIYFGSYPQSEVKDANLISALNQVEGNWISYDYYIGTDEADCEMKPSDFMRYKDVTYNGEKYRAVIFDYYRQYETCLPLYTNEDFIKTDVYKRNKVYWFKYEPIKWRVLDPSTGLVMCDTVINAQAFNNYIVYANGEYYGDSERTYYASNYDKSSIREWLNNDFYNTAFSEEDRSNIQETVIDNSSYLDYYSEYSAPTTEDKVFLLSYTDAFNNKYGLNSTSRQLHCSDYAKCQGLLGYDTYNNSLESCLWWLRSPGHSGYACAINPRGNENDDNYYTDCIYGIVPALRLNLNYSDVEIKVAKACTVNYKINLTIKADAIGVPLGCYVAIYIDDNLVAMGSNKSVVYEVGEINDDIYYTVKIVDENGNVMSDADGDYLVKNGGKITCDKSLIVKLVSFILRFLGLNPSVTIEP